MENILLTENGKSITFVCSSPRKRYYISLFLSLHQAASVGFWVDGNQRTLNINVRTKKEHSRTQS